MIKHVRGDLLQADADIICHQVNCRGKMGSGVAKQIRENFPEAYQSYMNLYGRCCANPTKLLGVCQIVEVERDGKRRYIANLFGQSGYGYDGRQYTDLNAFRRGIYELASKAYIRDAKSIALPYRIGCGRGGADWNTIYPIIAEGLRDFDVTLFEYKE